jgi:hypothetical protein
MSPLPRSPENVPVSCPSSARSVTCIETPPCGARTFSDHVPSIGDAGDVSLFFSSFGRRISRPSTKTRVTFASLSKSGLSLITTFAILPRSSEPSWRSTPKMRAGARVVARSASSAESPFSIALRMPGRKSPALPEPLTSANVAPLFASTAGVVGASWRSRITRRG